MHDTNTINQILEATEHRRQERRNFMRTAASAVIAAGGASVLAACGGGNSNNNNTSTTPAPAPAPVASTPLSSDQNILNFALNLEYLEAQFYSFATTGAGLPNSLLGGTLVQGAVTGGRQVTFTDPVVAQYAREIAFDERNHVAFLRQALGGVAVSSPAIDISSTPFTAAARAAGVVGATATFDPYASDENFLLGAFIFEDVGVTAYKGASPLLTSKTFLDAAAGILGAEAYHAGLIRTVLYAKGISTGTPALRINAGKISDARDSLDGATDLDQGITGDATTSNIVPTDASGIAFSRTTGQVLNIVYLNKTAVGSGGFFPTGLNGAITTSAASG